MAHGVSDMLSLIITFTVSLRFGVLYHFQHHFSLPWCYRYTRALSVPAWIMHLMWGEVPHTLLFTAVMQKGIKGTSPHQLPSSYWLPFISYIPQQLYSFFKLLHFIAKWSFEQQSACPHSSYSFIALNFLLRLISMLSNTLMQELSSPYILSTMSLATFGAAF